MQMQIYNLNVNYYNWYTTSLSNESVLYATCLLLLIHQLCCFQPTIAVLFATWTTAASVGGYALFVDVELVRRGGCTHCKGRQAVVHDRVLAHVHKHVLARSVLVDGLLTDAVHFGHQFLSHRLLHRVWGAFSGWCTSWAVLSSALPLYQWLRVQYRTIYTPDIR